jgi:hypothetical protein
MKKILSLLFVAVLLITVLFVPFSCVHVPKNETASQEQALTEVNQANLLQVQPPPKITWSLERDNLIKRFKLQNDRSIVFYMYIFIEGFSEPIGYYQVNKVSSVNSQLTNTQQIVDDPYINGGQVLPSPAEDGSYGTNGDAVFGFTPEEIYIEHNMKYIVCTVPLNFRKPVNKLTIINVETEKQLKAIMDKIK